MKQILTDAFTPNKSVGVTTKNSIFAFWAISTMMLWMFSGSHFFPSPLDIIKALQILVTKNDFIRELLTSTSLCIKAMLYAIIVSLFLAYLSILPAFRPIVAFAAKSRFLSTAGLTFFIGQITPDTASQKVTLLVFAITVFLVTSMLSIVIDVKKEELDYARTLRMSEWLSALEVIVKGKADQMFEVVKQNFAIAWMMLSMVESLCRADGGIGVLLGDKNKHFELDQVFAIQITVLVVGVCFDTLLKAMKQWFFPYSVIKLERK